VPNEQGALLVWSEELNKQAVVRFALLDRNARLVSEITTIVAPLAADNISPAVATDGSSFLLAWTEVTPGRGFVMSQLMVLRIDPTGRPIGVPIGLQSLAVPFPEEQVTAVEWTGSAFDVWGLRYSRFRIHTNDQVENLSPDAISFANIGDGFLRAGWMSITTTPPCGRWWCPRVTRWVLVWSTNGTGRHEYSPMTPIGPLAAAGGGAVQLVAWLTKGGIALARIQDDRVISEDLLPSEARTSAPGVAFDGTHYLLVYLTMPDELTGVVISTDGEIASRFPVAQGNKVYDLEVDTVAPGRFLVSYRTLADGSNLHGRVVVTKPSRRRAAR